MLVASSVLIFELMAANLISAATANPIDASYDIAYGKDSDRQVLDVIHPKGQKGRPVVFFVHGGGWILGDKSLFGLYRNFGRFLAEQGYVAVLINYRLSPKVRHPAHIKDVACAYAWTRRHIQEYGGDPDRIYLCGHSAGGHLVALLTTCDSFLKDEKLKLDEKDCQAIRGVIALSGVYLIPSDDEFARLAADLVTKFIDPNGKQWGLRPAVGQMLKGLKDHNPYVWIFGDDPKMCEEASPIKHVHKGLPPFLLVNAEWDIPTLPGMAKDFAKKLEQNKVEVKTVTLRHRDHTTMVFRATSTDDPLAKAVLGFIKEHEK